MKYKVCTLFVKRSKMENKTGAGRGLAKLCKINNVVTMLNDMKDFCWLDLKCSVMFCFT